MINDIIAIIYPEHIAPGVVVVVIVPLEQRLLRRVFLVVIQSHLVKQRVQLDINAKHNVQVTAAAF